MNSIFATGLKFFLRFFLVYTILTGISLIPAVVSFFNVLYCIPAEKGLRTLFPKAYINAAPEKDDGKMIRIEYTSKKKLSEYRKLNKQGPAKSSFQIAGKVYQFKFYNLFFGFYVFFLTLMIISPLPIKELLISMLIGSVLYYLYTLMKVSITLFILFNQPESGIYQSSPGVINFFNNLLYFLTLGISVLVVLLIWAGLVFRKGNWKTIFK